MQEVATFVSGTNQFETGESAFECVAFSASLLYYATKPGTANPHSAEQIDQLADYWYAKLEGSYGSSNTNGMSLDAEHTMLDGMGLKWLDLGITALTAHDSDIANVKAALAKGYPVLICGAETGFVYAHGDAVPYAWQPSGNHAIVTSSIAPSGNLLVRDMAALKNGNVPGSLQEYDTSRMQLISGTAIIPSWMSGGGSMAVPSGWSDVNNMLTAPNGHKVVLGFRDYILAHNWDANNWPLEEEQHCDPLEVGNPSLGSGQQQLFRWTGLEWTASRGVFEAWLGQELLAVRAQHVPPPVPQPPNVLQAIADLKAAQAESMARFTAILKELGG